MKKYGFISGVILALIAFACLAPIYNPPTGSSGATIASTSSVLKGDGAGNGVAATQGTDYARSGYTTTVTAAGTTTLTAASNRTQFFTGSSAQVIALPVASTLYLGYDFLIFNASSAGISVSSSGGASLGTVVSGDAMTATCVLASGTTAASWKVTYNQSPANLAAQIAAATAAVQASIESLLTGYLPTTTKVTSFDDADDAHIPSALLVKTALNTASGSAAFFDPTGGSISGAIVTGNIASVTWSSAGNYDVLFTTVEPDTNYVVRSVSETDTQPGYFAVRNKSTNGFTLRSFTPSADIVTGVIGYAQADPVAVELKVSR